MKTQLTLISLMIATLSPAIANASIDVEPFLGMGTGMNFDRVDSDNDMSGAIQLRAGVTLEENHRLMLSYQYSDELEQNNYLASYDYLYPIHSNVSLFAGASAGISDSKLGHSHESESVWGGQMGAVYQFDESWSLELAYRYLDQDNQSGGESLDSTQQLSASIDFRF
ncbi:porin family protein [Vibrio harveyi]|uniref:outer membrane beta-barrel protein n=1 Tax=Vibrio harveyi TaxID=669 RepID=UPI001C968E7E|nr:outer membrane beta-barrel protein [Vibrio harveyi]MBY6236865.1 porin family protein [Vibrio harveyi]MCG9611962.1 porin family protein [Vibrio harveyi]MCG9669877.1 porin family protein [Vibrio harveyi]